MDRQSSKSPAPPGMRGKEIEMTATLIARRAAAAAHHAAPTAVTEAALIAAIRADEDQRVFTLIGGRELRGRDLMARVRKVREARVDRDLSYRAQTILNKQTGVDGAFEVARAYVEACCIVEALSHGAVAHLVA